MLLQGDNSPLPALVTNSSDMSVSSQEVQVQVHVKDRFPLSEQLQQYIKDGSGIVQVPAHLIRKALAMINTSESALYQLQEQSKSFPQFRLLPPELRLKIWNMALDEPQVICAKYSEEDTEDETTYHLLPTNRHQPLRSVNQEARSEALKVQFRLIDNEDDPPIYINSLYDTLWVDCLDSALPRALGRCNFEVYSIAIDHKFVDKWWRCYYDSLDREEMADHETFVYDMTFLADNGVVEILLVVNHQDLTTCEDIVFRTPDYPPSQSCIYFNCCYGVGSKNSTPTDSWEDAEERANDFMEVILDVRREVCEAERFDEDSSQCFIFGEDFSLPIIRFVEAFSASTVQNNTPCRTTNTDIFRKKKTKKVKKVKKVKN